MVWPFKKKTKKQVAKIEITGAIAGDTRKRVLKAFKTVEEKKFPALLLRIDSPGGTVGDSQEIYSALQRLQEDKNVKVVASFGNISASGGVYIGVGAKHIVANPGTITGSIGVILRGNNLERLLDKIGVSFKVVKSGPYKDILAFDRQLTPAEEQILQELIDISYQQFVKTVAEGRNLEVEKLKAFADGRKFSCNGAKLFVIQNGLPVNRIAFTFARKYGNAVQRNRSRRLSREVFRLLKARLRSGYDLVLLVYPGGDTFNNRMEQLEILFQKAGLFLDKT
jgi:protease-4